MSQEKNKVEMMDMVGWYDPGQLVNTGIMTAISTIIGEYADPRAGTADPTKGKFFDYSNEIRRTEDDFNPIEGKERKEIWIDYAADVGDGWNSTYAVAYYLSKPTLDTKVKDETRRGEILILGGDGVYPTASPDEYKKRLVTPYQMAFKAGGTSVAETRPDAVNLSEEPHVFALPGNHDWYDSLMAFRKLFCSHIFNERRFACFDENDSNGGATQRGGWRTRQKRSYFAVKLPHGWWLLGVDLQLTHNIDVSQLEYFESISKQMKPGDKIILCVPEPYWVKAIKYEKHTDKFEKKEESIEKLEKFFERKGMDIKVYLAGDLHHYRRFEADDNSNVHKITAGGGGAFLHPTHDFDFRKHRKKQLKKTNQIREKTKKRLHFILREDYPGFKESRKQTRKNFLFLWNNKKFGAVTAVIYTILAWFIYGGIEQRPEWAKENFAKAFDNLFNNAPGILGSLWAFLWVLFNGAVQQTSARLIREPVAALIVILMIFGLIFFTDSNSKLQKWLGGALHALSHLLAAFLLGWFSYLLGVMLITKYEIEGGYCLWSSFCIPHAFWIWLLCIAFLFLAGWIVGSIIMGLYLFISLRVFGRHDNEAFSSLKIQDYKNFLRLHINEEGLTIYPFKIEKVPRKWKGVPDDENPDYFEPIDGSGAELIEAPIKIK